MGIAKIESEDEFKGYGALPHGVLWMAFPDNFIPEQVRIFRVIYPLGNLQCWPNECWFHRKFIVFMKNNNLPLTFSSDTPSVTFYVNWINVY